jgi:hypothetical protein
MNNFTTVPLRYLGVDAATATTFFMVFSRFEYALKFAGYRYPGRRAKPSWDDFATAIADPFDAALAPEKTVFLGAVAYLTDRPPNQQVQEHGQLSWAPFERRDQDDARAVHHVLDAVQQVRNNLFHGGKYFDSQAQRDEALIGASIAVLKTCVDMDAGVHAAYFDIA